MSRSYNDDKQVNKFMDVLLDSGWDLGLLAEKLIALQEKKK